MTYCDTCYWRLTGCGKDGELACGYYYPNDYDESFAPQEHEYDVAPEGTWEQAGFSVRTLLEDIKKSRLLL